MRRPKAITTLPQTSNSRATALALVPTVGWQWITKGGFSIDTQVGWGYNQNKFRDIEVRYEDDSVEMEEAPSGTFRTMLPSILFLHRLCLLIRSMFKFPSLACIWQILFYTALNFSPDCPHPAAKFALFEIIFAQLRLSMKNLSIL